VKAERRRDGQTKKGSSYQKGQAAAKPPEDGSYLLKKGAQGRSMARDKEKLSNEKQTVHGNTNRGATGTNVRTRLQRKENSVQKWKKKEREYEVST